MNTERLTISLPKQTVLFLQGYKTKEGLKSTSQVILKALELLEKEALKEEFSHAAEDAKHHEAFILSTLETLHSDDETW